MQVKQQEKLKKAAWDLPDTELAYGKENNATGMEKWSVEQGIKNPLEYVAESKLGNQRIEQSKTDLEKRKAELIKDVRSAYFDVLFAKEKVELMEDLKNIFSELSKAGKLRYETGDVSYLEKVSAQVKFKEIKVAEEEVLNLLVRNTNTLMNRLFVNDTIRLLENQLDKITMEDSYSGIDSLDSNPEVALFKQKWRTKQAESKAVKSISWPDPFFRYSRNNFSGNESFSAFELGVRIPLDIWAEKGRNQAAEIDAEVSLENFRMVENNMMTAYRNIIKNLETYSQQLEYFENRRLKEADMITKSASRQYEAGNIDYLQYIQFFDQATRIRLDYLDVLNAYNQNIIEIQYLTGQ